MKFVCDAPDRKTWFRIETEVEADQESALMNHAVAKHFRRAAEAAMRSYKPTSNRFIEQDIGIAAHLRREMPVFLTLRDSDGNGLATAMLPPRGEDAPDFRKIIVGPDNKDPYPDHGTAIEALAAHFAMPLQRYDCYPYAR